MGDFNRRDFLKITGGIAAGVGVGAVASASPFKALQWLVEWSQDQYVPERGSEKYISALCGLCPSRCPVSLRMNGRRAVKSDNGNKGCALSQLIVQSLYHPDRITKPLKRSGSKGSGSFTEISWESAVSEITINMNSLISSGKSNRMAAVRSYQPSAEADIFESIIRSTGSPHCYREASHSSISAPAAAKVTGIHGGISYDLTSAGLIILFSADIFGGYWQNPAAMNELLLKTKSENTPIIYIGTNKTRTASLASRFIPIQPGTESLAALGIAAALMARGSGGMPDNSTELRTFFKETLTRDQISAATGISASIYDDLASEYARAKNPTSVAGCGAADASGSSALYASTLMLNGMTGNFGKTVYQIPVQNSEKSYAGLDSFIKESHDIDMLFLYNTNPVHKSTLGKLFSDKISSVKTVVSFSPFISDSDMYADYIIPAYYPIESAFAAMELSAPGSGSVHPVDALIRIGKQLQGRISIPYESAASAEKGFSTSKGISPSRIKAPIDIFAEEVSRIKTAETKKKNYPLSMMPIEFPSSGDGTVMAYPYMQKNHPDYLLHKEKLTVFLNHETAKTLGISEGESVEIQTERGSYSELRASLSGLYAPGVIAVPVGFGHKGLTRYADMKGCNIKQIASADIDPVTGYARWHITPAKLV